MKSILVSIKPKYVADILNGRKTIEIRKNMPKCELPITVYIYCTKEDSLAKLKTYQKDTYVCEQEFKCEDFPKLDSGYEGKGKVVAMFTLNKVEEMVNPCFPKGTFEIQIMNKGRFVCYTCEKISKEKYDLLKEVLS